MESLFLWTLFFESFPKLLERLHITLAIVVIALAFGLIFGIGIAMVRVYRVPVLSRLAVIYVSLMRGIPLLVLLYIVYIGLPLLVGLFGVNINRVDSLWFVMLAYTLNSAAFLSEIVRAAVSGVEAGQLEAAYSIGMDRVQAFRRIVVPQALQLGLPAFGNNVVALLKDTSLAFTLGVVDIIGAIKAISNNTFRSLEAYAAAAVIFFVLSFILEIAFGYIEKKLGAKHSTPV